MAAMCQRCQSPSYIHYISDFHWCLFQMRLDYCSCEHNSGHVDGVKCSYKYCMLTTTVNCLICLHYYFLIAHFFFQQRVLYRFCSGGIIVFWLNKKIHCIFCLVILLTVKALFHSMLWWFKMIHLGKYIGYYTGRRSV